MVDHSYRCSDQVPHAGAEDFVPEDDRCLIVLEMSSCLDRLDVTEAGSIGLDGKDQDLDNSA